MNKTSARPLALVYCALVVYASLYPFADWRDQGIAPWAFLAAPISQYWTAFDVFSNALGYLPLGFLAALSVLRGGHGSSGWRAFALGALIGGTLSLVLESTQSYLPERVPSKLDFALNLTGSCAGAALACVLDQLGWLARWSQFRNRWFVPEPQGALALLALWPLALLFPATVPMGLGRVMEPVETQLGQWLEDTPFLNWLPLREVELQPLVPGVEMLCVMLGMLAPVLLGHCVVGAAWRRVVLAGALIAAGIFASALSATLSYGPEHAWAWLSQPAQAGLALAFTLSLLLIGVPSRFARALLLIALTLHLAIINQAPQSAYFAQTLQDWEQGRFIRFHGLAQWLGWLWPLAAMLHVLGQFWRRETLKSRPLPGTD
jgi:VanZ family protein